MYTLLLLSLFGGSALAAICPVYEPDSKSRKVLHRSIFFCLGAIVGGAFSVWPAEYIGRLIPNEIVTTEPLPLVAREISDQSRLFFPDATCSSAGLQSFNYYLLDGEVSLLSQPVVVDSSVSIKEDSSLKGRGYVSYEMSRPVKSSPFENWAFLPEERVVGHHFRVPVGTVRSTCENYAEPI